jgi:hypothetical protein
LGRAASDFAGPVCGAVLGGRVPVECAWWKLLLYQEPRHCEFRPEHFTPSQFVETCLPSHHPRDRSEAVPSAEAGSSLAHTGRGRTRSERGRRRCQHKRDREAPSNARAETGAPAGAPSENRKSRAPEKPAVPPTPPPCSLLKQGAGWGAGVTAGAGGACGVEDGKLLL